MLHISFRSSLFYKGIKNVSGPFFNELKTLVVLLGWPRTAVTAAGQGQFTAAISAFEFQSWSEVEIEKNKFSNSH